MDEDCTNIIIIVVVVVVVVVVEGSAKINHEGAEQIIIIMRMSGAQLLWRSRRII